MPLNAIGCAELRFAPVLFRTCGLPSLPEQAQQTSPSVAELRLALHWQQLLNTFRNMVKLYNYESNILHSPDHSNSLFL
jgi:hypothetical protein